MTKPKTKYFKTYTEAKAVADSLPPFKPSKFLAQWEIDDGLGNPQVNQFLKGYAVQLGCCGAYYPATENT